MIGLDFAYRKARHIFDKNLKRKKKRFWIYKPPWRFTCQIGLKDTIICCFFFFFFSYYIFFWLSSSSGQHVIHDFLIDPNANQAKRLSKKEIFRSFGACCVDTFATSQIHVSYTLSFYLSQCGLWWFSLHFTGKIFSSDILGRCRSMKYIIVESFSMVVFYSLLSSSLFFVFYRFSTETASCGLFKENLGYNIMFMLTMHNQ